MKQKNIFIKEEANAWYERNKFCINNKSANDDPIFIALQSIDLKPKRILEIGCSNGWRLAMLAEHYNADCYGIDPSIIAIEEGNKIFPNLNLSVGTADCLPDMGPFDLVIFGFCLYLCDPQDLFKIAADSNHLLANEGHIAILDFNPPAEHYRNKYQHRTDVFSYKMNYGNMFCWHPSYLKIFEKTQNHDGSQKIEPDALISVQILRKDSRFLSAQNPYINGFL